MKIEKSEMRSIVSAFTSVVNGIEVVNKYEIRMFLRETMTPEEAEEVLNQMSEEGILG